MRIVFHDAGSLDYTPQTPFDRPLGGTEAAVAYLSAALAARGHDVALVNRSSFQGMVRGVRVTGHDGARTPFVNGFDVLISVTRPLGAEYRRLGVRIPIVCWEHQAATSQRVTRFANEAEKQAWSGMVFVSEHQKRGFLSKFGLDGHVLRNAASPSVLATPVSPDCFLDRGEDPVLIYASGPGRGLDLVLFAFPSIREQLPGARLRICSDGGIYQQSADQDQYRGYYVLARALAGVEFTGSVSQAHLSRHYANADILAYPTTFVETSCIVAIEAAASGCLFVGSDLGALRETLSGHGVFLPVEESRPERVTRFADLLVQTVREARADPDSYRRRRLEQAQAFRVSHRWEVRAQEWEQWLEGRLSADWQAPPTD